RPAAVGFARRTAAPDVAVQWALLQLQPAGRHPGLPSPPDRFGRRRQRLSPCRRPGTWRAPLVLARHWWQRRALAIGASTPKVKQLSIPDPHAAAPGPNAPAPGRLLSVVVPAFNEEAGLDPLLARLRPALAELGIDWEVIIVDDGSGDATRAKLKSL